MTYVKEGLFKPSFFFNNLDFLQKNIANISNFVSLIEAKFMRIAEIILPLALQGTFSYEVPDGMRDAVCLGKRVLVNFGKKKIYTGVVVGVYDSEKTDDTGGINYKPITAVLDDKPFISEPQLKLWNWMSTYYCCTVGEIFAAAVPSVLLPTSESKYNVIACPTGDEPLSGNELLLYNCIVNNEGASLADLVDCTNLKNPLPAIQRLVTKGLISDEQVVGRQYRPVERNYVVFSLPEVEKNADSLDKVLSKNGKQKLILETLVEMCRNGNVDKIEVEERELLVKCDASKSSLLSLQKYGLLLLCRKVRESASSEICGDVAVVLSDEQQRAYDEINEAFAVHSPVLLHGVTSSGKTELYVKLIQKTIARGRKVLYLLPEIALTAQLIGRLEKYFGTSVKVYHSKYTASARASVYNAVIDGKYEIILGVRSSVLLPFENLGLIIVDEEHENSYKQFDPDPRYNARDMALVMAKIHGASVILGSATPSVESYNNALQGRYRLVELKHRYGNVMLPVIEVADMKDAYHRKINKGHFHPRLITAINEAVGKGEQVILFQNRRGYSSMLECKACGWVPHCQNCNVSLTLHKYENKLVCHYCGEKFNVPSVCGNCGAENILQKGLGTEKLEEQVMQLFPAARVARLDYDTAQSRKNFENIVSEFEHGNYDILIGTQMITKGLDFPNVSLVGILNADNMLNFPDFRAFERSFQLMAQVAGRAGRRQKRGLVIIQTFTPDHQIIGNVLADDYKSMVNNQLKERSILHYPPLWNFIVLRLKHKDNYLVQKASYWLAQELRKSLLDRVRGPEEPAVNRISNYFIMNVHIRFEKTLSAQKIKAFVMEKLQWLRSVPEFSQVKVEIDVDPY